MNDIDVDDGASHWASSKGKLSLLGTGGAKVDSRGEKSIQSPATVYAPTSNTVVRAVSIRVLSDRNQILLWRKMILLFKDANN